MNASIYHKNLQRTYLLQQVLHTVFSIHNDILIVLTNYDRFAELLREPSSMVYPSWTWHLLQSPTVILFQLGRL